MKGKLLIEPGFEAGSLYCGECKYPMQDCETDDVECDIYEEELRFESSENQFVDFKRCQQFLDAEREWTEK